MPQARHSQTKSTGTSYRRALLGPRWLYTADALSGSGVPAPNANLTKRQAAPPAGHLSQKRHNRHAAGARYRLTALTSLRTALSPRLDRLFLLSLKHCQDFVCVGVGLHFGEDRSDLSYLIDDVGNTVGTHILFAIHTFFAPGPIG